jgi:RNA polymerase sigma-70 factor (ECF subfamily)
VTGSASAALDPAALSLHLPRLTRVAVRLSGSREDGEDLLQDTLERLLRSRRRTVESEYAYLVRCLRNKHVDRVRADMRRVATTAMTEALESVLEAPDRTVATLEAREVLAAVAQLPRPYRDAVVAVDVAGLAYGEAAEALGIPIGTVMSRLYRGRQRLMSAAGGNGRRGSAVLAPHHADQEQSR